MQELPSYILLAQRRSLYLLSLDGTRKRTVVSDTFSDILAMDYHYRYTSNTNSEPLIKTNIVSLIFVRSEWAICTGVIRLTLTTTES